MGNNHAAQPRTELCIPFTIEMRVFIFILQRVRTLYRKTSFSFLWQLPIHKTLNAQGPILHMVMVNYTIPVSGIQLSE